MRVRTYFLTHAVSFEGLLSATKIDEAMGVSWITCVWVNSAQYDDLEKE